MKIKRSFHTSDGIALPITISYGHKVIRVIIETRN